MFIISYFFLILKARIADSGLGVNRVFPRIADPGEQFKQFER